MGRDGEEQDIGREEPEHPPIRIERVPADGAVAEKRRRNRDGNQEPDRLPGLGEEPGADLLVDAGHERQRRRQDEGLEQILLVSGEALLPLP